MPLYFNVFMCPYLLKDKATFLKNQLQTLKVCNQKRKLSVAFRAAAIAQLHENNDENQAIE